jgi:predicted nucleotidyltransferase
VPEVLTLEDKGCTSQPTQSAPNMGAIAPILGAAAQALFGKTRRSLLALFFGHPGQSYHMRAVAATAGLGQGAVQRELVRLAGAGLITRERRGRQVYYQANQAHPAYVLRAALMPLSARISVAFVYGSLAAGAARESSDVDVLIVGDVAFAEVVNALRFTEDALGREVNPSVYPPEEFASRLRAGAHFVTSVVRGEKVFLIGGEHELGRLVPGGLADGAQDEPAGDR